MYKQNNNWDYWFAGIFDGDGYFYINNKEVTFELTTTFFDKNILYSIKNNLNGGYIKEVDQKVYNIE